MAKGGFTTKANPTYDDLPEVRYHFPRTYLNQVKTAVGDWIVFITNRGGKTQIPRDEAAVKRILQLRECNGLKPIRVWETITMLS